MDLQMLWLLAVIATFAIGAATAVLAARCALRGTKSQDRAAVLSAAADIIRALRGKR